MDDEKDLTASEEEEMEETGATSEEAHRIGEFEDLKDKLDGIAAKVDGIYEFIGKRIDELAESLVDSGVSVSDSYGNDEKDIVVLDDDSTIADILDDLDLDLSDIDTPERNVFTTI